MGKISKVVSIVDGIEFTNSIKTTTTIALWNDNTIVWYERRNDNKLNEIHGKVLSCKRTFIIEKDGKKAVYSLDGYELIPFDNYEYIMEHPYAIEVKKDCMVAAYSYEGNQIVPFIAPMINCGEYGIFIEPFGFVYKGLYSYKGEVIVPKEYNIRYIDNDIMICSIEDEENNEVYGMYSHDGDVLIPFEYDSIEQYKKCVLAEKNKKCGILSNRGEVLVPFEYYDIRVLDENNHNYFIVSKERDFGKGLYKYTGKEILPPLYDDILYAQGFIITEKDEYFGLYTAGGLELLKPIYNHIRPCEKDIFFVKTAGGAFYYIASINRRIYADDVRCIGKEYAQLNDNEWTIIGIY